MITSSAASQEDIRKEVAALNRTVLQLTMSRARAKKFLMDVGVYDAQGNLTPEFGGKKRRNKK